ncbi:hypothetical protein [Pseudomonas denitrificans (nom. rej.)]|uniref:Uncharacterized protein n=1 Tax=Pseudomonas denitrificans TaxID=43306 RepID=A0A9X7MZ97_PSEDE|nr:hypothetical protein [Pseudomonas denitrificans (nom. rej.)]QEY72015.1 hypothetical protein F1C79_10540 [Pseudomonas denitrificans (nom. rej.)]
MECLLYVLAEAKSQEHLAQVLLNLSVEKPVIEDDVEPQWQPLFLALEFLPMPDSALTLKDERLLVSWPIQPTTSPCRYLEALQGADLRLLGVMEAYEDGGYQTIALDTSGKNGRFSEEPVFCAPGRVAAILGAGSTGLQN